MSTHIAVSSGNHTLCCFWVLTLRRALRGFKLLTTASATARTVHTAPPAAALLGPAHTLPRAAERPFADGTRPQASSLTLVATTLLSRELAHRGRTVAAADVAEAPPDGCRRHFAERGLEPAALCSATASRRSRRTNAWHGARPQSPGAAHASAVVKGAVLAPRRRRGLVLQPARWIGNMELRERQEWLRRRRGTLSTITDPTSDRMGVVCSSRSGRPRRPPRRPTDCSWGSRAPTPREVPTSNTTRNGSRTSRITRATRRSGARRLVGYLSSEASSCNNVLLSYNASS